MMYGIAQGRWGATRMVRLLTMQPVTLQAVCIEWHLALQDMVRRAS